MLGRPSVSLGVKSKTLAVVVATRQPKGIASLSASHSCPCWEEIYKLWLISGQVVLFGGIYLKVGIDLNKEIFMSY